MLLRPVRLALSTGAVLVALAAPAGAQEPMDGATLSPAYVPQGAYAAPALKLTTLRGEGSLLAGGEGGWLLGHELVVGGAGYVTAARVGSLGIGYGGFRLGMIIGANDVVHGTVGLLMGGGEASSTSTDGSFKRSDGFLVLEPDVAGELRLGAHARVALGGGYRFVHPEAAAFTTADLSGPVAMLTLRVGEF